MCTVFGILIYLVLHANLLCYCEQGEASMSTSQPENGFTDSVSLMSSEKAVHELLQQIPVHGTDDHLIEFSEALTSMNYMSLIECMFLKPETW